MAISASWYQRFLRTCHSSFRRRWESSVVTEVFCTSLAIEKFHPYGLGVVTDSQFAKCFLPDLWLETFDLLSPKLKFD